MRLLLPLPARRSFRTVVVLLLAISSPASRVSSAQATSDSWLIEAGDQALRALDNTGAVRYFEEARALQGSSASADLMERLVMSHVYRSLDLITSGDRDTGEAEIDRAHVYARRLADEHPDRASAWFLLAIALGNQATFEGGRGKVRIGRAVEQHCLRAIELDPAYPEPHIVLGVFYREVSEVSWVQRLVANTLFGGLPEGSYRRSAELLQKAVDLDPSIPLARFELGRTLYRDGRFDEARLHLRAGYELSPMTTIDVRNAREARRLLGLIE